MPSARTALSGPTAAREPHPWRGRGERRRALFLALLALALPWACAAPPASSPPPAVAPKETVLAMLTVAAADVPLYAEPATTAAVVASLQSGDRLALLERHSEWLLVRTPSGARGYVQPSSLVAPQCTADRPEPVIVEEPLFRFDSAPPHGTVVVEAEYTAEGRLAGTRLLQNTIGDPAYEQRALEDLRKLRFLPPTEDCKPRPFFYTFRRQF